MELTSAKEMSGLRVLLAEDNEVNREVALSMLETLECSVEIAINGHEVADKALAGHFDAVLMDCQMPILNGFEATVEIRRREQAAGSKRLPIIAMTANTTEGDRELCIKSGMDEYVSKPVRRAALAEILAKIARCSNEARSCSHAQVGGHDCAVDLIQALETAGGRPDRLKRIFKAFLDDIPKRMLSLAVALQQAGRATAEREAHSIKGAAANIAAIELRASAFEVERACKSGELEQAAKLIPSLAKHVEAVVRELNVHIATEPALAGVAG
jgi:two-component system sensor histidine kinase/response regulator